MKRKTFRFSYPANVSEVGMNVPEEYALYRTEFLNPIRVIEGDVIEAMMRDGKVIVFFNGEEVPAKYTLKEVLRDPE